jgi:hypothetical protein
VPASRAVNAEFNADCCAVKDCSSWLTAPVKSELIAVANPPIAVVNDENCCDVPLLCADNAVVTSPGIADNGCNVLAIWLPNPPKLFAICASNADILTPAPELPTVPEPFIWPTFAAAACSAAICAALARAGLEALVDAALLLDAYFL